MIKLRSRTRIATATPEPQEFYGQVRLERAFMVAGHPERAAHLMGYELVGLAKDLIREINNHRFAAREQPINSPSIMLHRSRLTWKERLRGRID